MTHVKIWMFVLIALSLLGGVGAAVWACSCPPPPGPKASLEHSAAVFTGKVTKIVEVANLGIHEVTFHVDKQWKGITTAEVTVKTAASGATCGYGFAMGESYIVYAKKDGDAAPLWASICSRTALLKDAKTDLAELGPATPLPEKKP